MEEKIDTNWSALLGKILGFFRIILCLILSYGAIPNHVAFIMDRNHRFTKNKEIKEGGGHKAGYAALMSITPHCFEMGVKYVTVYAVSIDNFKRKPVEVESVMNLILEKVDELLEEESILNKYGIRIKFVGDLKLLSEPVRLAAEKAMNDTAKNTGLVLSVCVAYTSTNEIVHAIEESCTDKIANCANGCDNDVGDFISVSALEKHLYTADCPEPELLIRTSGETRLSNFLLWQTTYCHLQNPVPLWPELSFSHLVWSMLEYQKVYPYLSELRSKSKKKI